MSESNNKDPLGSYFGLAWEDMQSTEPKLAGEARSLVDKGELKGIEYYKGCVNSLLNMAARNPSLFIDDTPEGYLYRAIFVYVEDRLRLYDRSDSTPNR
ncbi:MAG: hypothetical protein V1900_01095 [Candidatus Aenigmatarchaeota archaeon]